MVISSGARARAVPRGGCAIRQEAAKGQVLVLAQVLVAEEDHRVFGERAMDFVEHAVAERLRQIDAADLAADDRRKLVDGDRVVWPGIFADILDAGPSRGAAGSFSSSYLGLLAEHARKIVSTCFR